MDLINDNMKRSEYNCPSSATHVKMNPSGKFIELFYRVGETQINDGTLRRSIEYRSGFDVWMGTSMDHDKILPLLTPIEDIEWIDEDN